MSNPFANSKQAIPAATRDYLSEGAPAGRPAAMMLAVAIGGGVLAGCASSPTVALQPVYQSAQCAVAEPRLQLITEPDALADILRALSPPGRPVPTAAAADTFARDRQLAVLIAWGNRPSSGYRLTLTASEARVEDGTLVIPLAFHEPQPDRYYAQVITSPCLILVAERAGYRQIRAGEMQVPLP